MRNSFSTAAFAAFLASSGLAAESDPMKMRLKVSMDQYETHLFENNVDHFSANDARTYKQRYWYNDKFFSGKEKHGPVFLYICGEWTCTPPDEQMYPMMVGAEHEALHVSLEHRYYGESQPFDSWATENMEYLSSKQALADIAHFIES